MFRVTGEDGVIRLAAVRTTVESLQEEVIRNALKYVINQIKAQAQRTGETRAYVRIDASHSPPTQFNSEEIGRFVKDEVLALIESNAIEKDLVEYVEVIYNDSTGQDQRTTFQVQNGDVVIWTLSS